MDAYAQELLSGMLAEHGIPLGDLPRERSLCNLHTSEHRGRMRIMPGPRFLSSAHPTDDAPRHVRTHWAPRVAGALRSREFGDAHPPHAYLVPVVAKAVAIAAGWTPEAIVSASHKVPIERIRPVDTPHCRNSERVKGQMPNDLSVRRRLETPDWFLHLSVEMHFSLSFPIARATHCSVTLRNLPAQALAAIPGQPLHRVLALPGMTRARRRATTS